MDDGRKRRKVDASHGGVKSACPESARIVPFGKDTELRPETSSNAALSSKLSSPEQIAAQATENERNDRDSATDSPFQVAFPDTNGFNIDTIVDCPVLDFPSSHWQQTDLLGHDLLEGMGASVGLSGDTDDFVLDLGSLGVANEVRLDLGLSQSRDWSSEIEPKQIRLRIFRRYGPTAVAPGLNKLSVAVKSCSDMASESTPRFLDTERGSRDCQRTISPGVSSGSQRDTPLADHFYGLPAEMLHKALGVFFEHFGGHFPFLNDRILAGHVHSNQASRFLINSILALTARFCSLDRSDLFSVSEDKAHALRGVTFLKKAKEQVMSLLGVPAPDVVAGLILLAWAEYGENNEAGLWMFSVMAIRMAQDLGLHRSNTTEQNLDAAFFDHAPSSPDGLGVLTDEQSTLHQQKARLVMFWSVFSMDVYVSLLMGHTPMIKRADIEVPLPTPGDMKVAQLDFEPEVSMKNIIFPEMIQHMLIFSEAVGLLNASKSAENIAGSEECLRSIMERLMQRYRLIHPMLQFNPANYKLASQDGNSGIF